MKGKWRKHCVAARLLDCLDSSLLVFLRESNPIILHISSHSSFFISLHAAFYVGFSYDLIDTSFMIGQSGSIHEYIGERELEDMDSKGLRRKKVWIFRRRCYFYILFTNNKPQLDNRSRNSRQHNMDGVVPGHDKEYPATHQCSRSFVGLQDNRTS